MKKLLLLVSFVGLVQLVSAQCNVTASSNVTVTCYGWSDGQAIANTGGGGTPPYTYLWTPTNQTTSLATGLTAGTYTVTLTDNVGCTSVDTVLITQPAVINPNATVLNTASCVNGNDACVISNPTGGNPGGYQYAWTLVTTPMGNQYTLCNITDNTYTVTVNDTKGCIGIDTVHVPQPSNPLGGSLTSSTNATCHGQCNGSVTFTMTGGHPPYYYHGSPLPGNTLTLNNLCAVGGLDSVQDNSGCNFQLVWSVGQPPALGGQDWTLNDATSCGTPNGCVYADPAGGSPPYTYSWTPSGGTGQTACGLGAGDYVCIVTDSHGCSTSLNAATITQPTSLSASTTIITYPLCHGGNGGCATVSTSGGTPPYTYSWAPTGGTSTTACGLTAGNYFAFVTDNTGCQINASAQITEPTVVTVSATVSAHVSCYGATDGCASATASGGTGPYSYDWNTPWDNCQLPAGTYTVTASDQNGCTATTTVIINQPNQLSITATGYNGTGVCGDAYIYTSSSGGTAPYTYWWNTTPTQTSQDATNLTAGTWTVSITDAHGCNTITSATVQDCWVGVANISSQDFIKVYPNPFHSSTMVHINSDRTSLVQLIIYDLMGKEIQKQITADETVEISNLSSGVYILRVQEINSGKNAMIRLLVE